MVLCLYEAMVECLGRWIPNSAVLSSKPQCGSKVNSVIHLSKIPQMSTFELCAKKENVSF